MGTALSGRCSEQAYTGKAGILLLVALPGIPLFHQIAVGVTVILPAAAIVNIGVEDFFGRCKHCIVYIGSAAQLRDEKGEVLVLREAAELRGGIETYIQYQRGVFSCQPVKEGPGCCFIGT